MTPEQQILIQTAPPWYIEYLPLAVPWIYCAASAFAIVQLFKMVCRIGKVPKLNNDYYRGMGFLVAMAAYVIQKPELSYLQLLVESVIAGVFSLMFWDAFFAMLRWKFEKAYQIMKDNRRRATNAPDCDEDDEEPTLFRPWS